MDIGNEISSSLSAAAQSDAVSVTMLRKTLDMQQQHAAQLLEAVPQAPRPAAGSAAPESIGQNFDQKA